MELTVCAFLALTRKLFLALTSPSPLASSVLAVFFRLLGSSESVSCELTLAVGVSSSPDLRIDPLGGIVVFGLGENKM